MDEQAGRADLGLSHWFAYAIAPDAEGQRETAAVTAPATFSAGKNSRGMP